MRSTTWWSMINFSPPLTSLYMPPLERAPKTSFGLWMMKQRKLLTLNEKTDPACELCRGSGWGVPTSTSHRCLSIQVSLPESLLLLPPGPPAHPGGVGGPPAYSTKRTEIANSIKVKPLKEQRIYLSIAKCTPKAPRGESRGALHRPML